MAHELHEQTMQSLSALAMNLDLLGDGLLSTEEATLDRLDRVRTLARDLVADLRRLVEDLRPPVLEHLGLAAALHQYAERELSEHGIRASFDVSDVDRRPPPQIEISLYRVAQEAISNIVSHSEAKSAGVTLKSAGGRLTLVVEDDGKGFDPARLLADPSATRGLGLLSMQERIASIAGTFSIDSSPDEGTRVRAEIPLEREDREP